MANYQKKIYYVTQAQYDILQDGGTVGGYTGIDLDATYFVRPIPMNYELSWDYNDETLHLLTNGADLGSPLTINQASYAVKAGHASSAGHAGSATKLETARTLTIGSKGQSFDGTDNVSWTLAEIGAAESGHTHNYAGSATAGGTATSAIKLATAITIGGVSFDGSTNINLPGVNTAGNQNTSGNAGSATKLETARTLTIGSTGKSFNGTDNVSWSLAEIAAAPATGSSSITKLGTIGTGTWQGTIISSTYGGTGVNNGGRTLAVKTNSGTLTFTNPSTTLTIANTASISGTNTGDQTNISGSSAYLTALDDRTLPPTDMNYHRVRAYFTSLGGLTGVADSNYQDFLVLNTYTDDSGGDMNALAFDKSEMKIRHYFADQAATSWGTPKTLAYTDSNISGTAANVTGIVAVANGGTGNTSVDTAPTASSTKMVTSGGVYTALASKQNSLSNPVTGTGTNKYLAYFNGTSTITGKTSLQFDSATNALTVAGKISAISKSFLIDHPTKPGYKLQYGSLEGPENGVYVRGRLTNSNIIELPEYWTNLIDEDSITVTLTAIGNAQKLFVESIKNNKIYIKNSNRINKNINCFYVVYGERKDVAKLEVEMEAK